jgi:sn-glycerol 3-phosphate transport system permease protein
MSADARALHRRRVWGKVGSYTLLTVLSVIVLFPIYITIVNSLFPSREILSQPPKFFPTDPGFGSYSDAWNVGHMGTYLKNSFIVTFLITIGQVLTAILAGYAFAFLEFPFKRVLFVVFLATLMVPFEVTIVTNVSTISDLGWYNTYAGLAVPFLATGFGAFLMRQSFLTLPHELRDAAALDGYGHWRFLWRVAVPLARPAVAALSVFAFLAAWNQYLWPLLITTEESMYTVVIGIKRMIAGGDASNEWNLIMATAMLAMLPPALVVILMQKWFVKGLVETEK